MTLQYRLFSLFVFLCLAWIPAQVRPLAYTVIVVHDQLSTSSAEAPVVENCGDAFIPIYQVQGSAAVSPFVGQVISTEGVVVGDFQTSSYVGGTKNGFFIQEPVGDGNLQTSDGLFVYSYLLDVKAGDHVRVRGQVVEYVTGTSSLTEIALPDQIWICSSGQNLAPTPLSLPISTDSDYEAYEGMLVTFPQPLVISEYYNFDRYGEIVLTSRRHLTPTAEFEPGSPEYYQAVQEYQLDNITLDDGRSSWYPDPALHPDGQVFDLDHRFRGGDTLQNVTGILDSYESLYRIQPIQGAAYTQANLRPVLPDPNRSDLLVASFNVLNYFTTLDMDGNLCGPLADQNCRGADSAEEFSRQRTKLLAALSAIKADVYGLVEIQNDQDQSVADLAAGLNDLLGVGTYSYIPTGYIGGDAIKVALLYKPARVVPVGGFALLTTTADPRFIDTLNRPVLTQSFTDLATGKRFTVAVNHLKSKSSACPDDPDLGDGQGDCNLTRTMAAKALVDWLATDPTASGARESLIIGDLNAYDKEDPVNAILEGPDDMLYTSDDYTDLIYDYLGEPAYSYVFDGQIGYLDHALADPTLADNVVGVTIWHINADEPDLIDYNMEFKADAQDLLFAPDPYRFSDHDPVIVSLSLDKTYAAVDDTYATPFGLALIISPPGVMGNDSLANPGDSLNVQLKQDVAKGTLTLNPDGSFTYLPEAGFSGWVTFTYELVSSSSGVVAEATVTITIATENKLYLPLVWKL